MIKVFQTKFTDKASGILGNCVAACFASLFEVSLREVPAIEEMGRDEAHEAVLAFLKKKGYRYTGTVMGMPPKDGQYYIASFNVPNSEIGHCVIVCNEEVVHDPRAEPVAMGGVYSHFTFKRLSE